MAIPSSPSVVFLDGPARGQTGNRFVPGVGFLVREGDRPPTTFCEMAGELLPVEHLYDYRGRYVRPLLVGETFTIPLG